MTTRIWMPLLSACLLSFCWPEIATATETGIKTPRPLWNTQVEEEEEEEEIDELENKKNPVRPRKKTETDPWYYDEAKDKESELKKEISVDMNFESHAGEVARACPQKWESEECLRATSQAALVLVSHYGATLEQEGNKAAMEPLKQECAASTAATQQDGIPAYAMKSAYTTCANKIYDIAEATDVKPDPSYYQLLIATVLCMDNKPQCPFMEENLKKWAK